MKRVRSVSIFMVNTTERRFVITGFLGGSITYRTGWHDTIVSAIQGYYAGATSYTEAMNSQISWEHLCRVDAEIIAFVPTCIFVDLAANHGNGAMDQGTSEALIRHLRVTCPNASILMPQFPIWLNVDSTTPNNAAVVAWCNTLATYYGATIVDIATLMTTLIGTATNVLTDWYTASDFTHPNAAGMEFISNQIFPVLTNGFLYGTRQWTGDLADYPPLYSETLSWSVTPQLRLAIDNDGETGVWSTVGTARLSSTALSTITMTTTCQSFGLDVQNGAGNGILEWKVDNGLYTQLNMATSNQSIRYLARFTVGVHTLTLRVVSGSITVNRMLAI